MLFFYLADLCGRRAASLAPLCKGSCRRSGLSGCFSLRLRTVMTLRDIPVFRSAYSASRNARAPAASRPSVGGGSFAPPCAPLSRPRTAGFFYPDKRWLCAGGRTERQRGWLPAQFLSLEGKRSHSRWGRRRRPLFPHGSCPARGRNHGGTLCTTKPVRTELVFRTHRLSSSGE